MHTLLLASTFEGFGDKILNVFDRPLADMSVVSIPTAAYAEEGYEDWLPQDQTMFRTHAKSFREFDLKGKTEEEVAEALKDADIIYVTGGNTYALLEHIQKSGFEKIVRKRLDEGAVYAGSSAGAIVTCPRMDFIEDMDDVLIGNPDGFSAMNLVDFLIMPHLDHKHYGPITEKILGRMKSGFEKVIGLYDDQALFVQGEYIQVL